MVKLVTDALDTVRRQVWQSARKLRDQSIAKKSTGARWALLKNPIDLTERACLLVVDNCLFLTKVGYRCRVKFQYWWWAAASSA